MNGAQHKKITVLLVGFVVIVLTAVVLGKQAYTHFLNQRLVPAPTPYLTPSPEDILVVKSAPQDGSTDVSLTQPLKIEFNRTPNESEFIFLLSPDTPYTMTIQDSFLTISPVSQWEEGMPYRYIIRYPDPARSSQAFDFVTGGKAAVEIPDTQPDPTYIVGQNQYELENFPDTYVANRTPFENEYFTVESEFRRGTPQGHSYFIVAGKGGYSQDEVREAFEDWLRSIGLSSEQIDGLDVEYF